MEPRRWAHLPIDTNFIGGGYAYTEADIDFDPVLRIENGQMDLHTWAAKYIRSFALFGKMARIELLQAYQEGRWEGLLDGVPASVKRSGWSDTNVRFAINLYGSPPMKGKKYGPIGQRQRLRLSSEQVWEYSYQPVTTWMTN